MTTARRDLFRRSFWTFASQGFSSASNFSLTVLVLAAASPKEFATFSICITTYLLILQLSRALVSLPLLVLYTDASPSGSDPAERSALAATLGIGVIAGGGLALAAYVTEPYLTDAGAQFLILGASMPLLLLQDATRHVALARGKPEVAALSDTTWIVLQLVGALIAWRAGHGSGVGFLVAWCTAGSIAGGLALAALHTAPAPKQTVAWLREHQSLWRQLLGEFVLSSGSFYLVYYGLAIVAGAAQFGNLKAAQTLLGPVIVLLLGGINLGVSESVRRRESAARLRRWVEVLGFALIATAVAVGAAVYVVLPWLGPKVFSNSWAGARPLIPLLTVFAAAVGASTAAVSGLRALMANSAVLRARGASGLIQVVIALPAAAAFGANGALFGMAVAEWLFVLWAWSRFSRLLDAEASTPN